MPSVRRALAILLLSSLSTCGGSNNPAAPSGPAQIAGVYTGRVTPTTITGGECVGCQVAAVVGIQCGNGAIRDIQLVAGAFTGTVIGSRIEGTEAETWNTFVSGTTTGTGPMVINGQFDIYRH
jgi:hypothetical protein